MSRFAFDPDNYVPRRPAKQSPRRVAPPSEWAATEGTVAEIGLRDSEHLPRVWRDGLRQLNTLEQPAGASSTRWRQIVLDAHRLLWGWHDELDRLGWSTGAIFGFDERQQDEWVSLAVDLRGDMVVNLWRDERGRDVAAMRTATGGYRWHYRQAPDDSPPIWIAGERRR